MESFTSAWKCQTLVKCSTRRSPALTNEPVRQSGTLRCINLPARPWSTSSFVFCFFCGYCILRITQLPFIYWNGTDRIRCRDTFSGRRALCCYCNVNQHLVDMERCVLLTAKAFTCVSPVESGLLCNAVTIDILVY